MQAGTLARGQQRALATGCPKALRSLNGRTLTAAPERQDWKLCRDTTDYQLLTAALDDARHERLYFAISQSAGSGKSAILKDYAQRHENVFYLSCWEWQVRELTRQLFITLGVKVPASVVFQTRQRIFDLLIRFLRLSSSPMLILDEADKLSPDTIQLLIPMYNELENHLSVVISGTNNLEKQFRSGVARQKKGYDELEIRFGRSYFSLFGATKEDVRKIAETNRYTGDLVPIWTACDHSRSVLSEGSSQLVFSDLRRLKRVVQKAKLMSDSKPE